MDFRQALDFLAGRRSMGMKLGLQRVWTLLDCFGNPQDHVPAIHVAGTNGKGSTCAYFESIYRKNGYRTGLFTSPFLLSPVEMFRVNGKDIDQEAFSMLVCEAQAYCRELDKQDLGPTEYEIYAVLALEYFKRMACEIAIIEVGMGGRDDCTNVLTGKIASVITKISYDHTDFLGKTLGEIAWHKAGIIAPQVPVISWPQEPTAMTVIADVASTMQSPLTVPDFKSIEIDHITTQGSAFRYRGSKTFRISKPGEHQVQNAVMAYETAMMLSADYPVKEDKVREGLAEMIWPARFEYLRKKPDLILDCAHNPDGVCEFVKTYKGIYGERKATIIFGVMKDKDYENMVRQLSTIAEGFILIQPDTPRAISVTSLKETVDKYCEFVTGSDTIDLALLQTLDKADENSVICALGSIYYAGSLKETFQRLAQN